MADVIQGTLTLIKKSIPTVLSITGALGSIAFIPPGGAPVPAGTSPDIVRQIDRGLTRMVFFDVKINDKGTEDISLLTALLINPTEIKVEKSQIISKTLTRGGFAIQYWGEDLPRLSIVGTTGYYGVRMDGTGIDPLKAVINVAKLEAFNLLKNRVFNMRSRDIPWTPSMENPFNAQTIYTGNPILRMTFLGGVYDGYMPNFDYTQSANTPNAMDYGFTFVITEVKIAPLYGFSLW